MATFLSGNGPALKKTSLILSRYNPELQDLFWRQIVKFYL